MKLFAFHRGGEVTHMAVFDPFDPSVYRRSFYWRADFDHPCAETEFEQTVRLGPEAWYE